MRFALTLGCALAFLLTNGQGNLFTYTDLTIRSGTLYISGDWTHGDSITTDKVYSSGHIFLNGNLSNKSPTGLFGSDSTGSIIFQGHLQSVAGDSAIGFNDIQILSTGKVVQQQNSKVLGTVKFTSGQWQLNGQTIHLDDRGIFQGESNASNIVGDSGHVDYWDPALTGPSSLNIQGTGISVQAPLINFGNTQLERHHSAIKNVADSSIKRSYKWTSTFSGLATTVVIEYLDQWEMNGIPEYQLALYKSSDNGSTWRKFPTILDTVLNTLTALNLQLDTCILTLANTHCANPPAFNLPDTVWICEGDSALITGGTTHFHDWSTGATSDTIYINNNGIYWVTVFDSAGCETVDTFQIVVDSIPSASFTNALACEGDTTFFTNTSYYWNGVPQYKWDFGDTLDPGDTSALTSPGHPYQNPGTWQVNLIAQSPNGCSDTATANIVVFNRPVAGFTSSNSCLGDITQFHDTSGIAIGVITKYQWELGDTNTSAVQHPQHTYNDTGTYTVQVKVTSNTGCTDSTTRIIKIHPPPNLAFTPLRSCAKDSISFTYTGDSLTAIHWKFSATDSVTIFNPKYAYPFPGNFQVSIKGVNSYGCTDTSSHHVVIDSIPNQPWLTGATSTCDSTLWLDCGVPGATYLWSNGDTTQQTIVTASGWTSIAVQYGNGCAIKDSIAVSLNVPFKPNLGPDTSVCGSLILDAGFPGSTYLWSDYDTTRYKTIDQNGTYAVTVTDPNTCVGSDTVEVVIRALPTSFLPNDTSICYDSTTLLFTIGSWHKIAWSTGDTTSTNLITTSGRYYCTVIDSNQCAGTDSVLVNFGTRPAHLSDRWIQMCGHSSVYLKGDASLSSWQWWRGSTMLSTAGSIQISDTGTYTLQQIDQVGCSYTDTFTLNEDGYGIEANFLVNSQTTIADTLQFVNVSAVAKGNVQYDWSFGDGITSTLKHPTHAYYLTGSFSVALRINNEYCADSIFKPVSIVVQKRDSTTQREVNVHTERFKEVSVWPNPNFGQFNVRISSIGISEFELFLFDHTGRTVSKHYIPEAFLSTQYTLPFPTAGMYFLVAKSTHAMKTVKVIILQ